MSKQKRSNVFVKVVCVGARSGIIAALYLAAFLATLELAAALPEPWSAVGITVLLLVTGLRLSGTWPGRKFHLESVGLGYQPDGPANLRPATPVSPKDRVEGTTERERREAFSFLQCAR
jgi:hypothetical protein